MMMFLFLFIPNVVNAFQWVKYSTSMDSYVYLGSTPYQNETFKSSNISNALRIQRDIATNVTIDQLIWPAINTTPFSGPENVSNALTMGYKRLVVDLYWTNSSEWRLESFALEEFLESVHDYLVSTDLSTAPTKTNLVFLILNLHDNTTITTNVTTSVQDTQLGQLVQNTFGSRLYTPFNLTADRIASFYAQGSYFPIMQKPAAAAAWPTWLYLIERRLQVLVGYGTLPAQASFRLSLNDNNTIFSAEDMGGYMNNNNNSSHTSCPVNQSWAFVDDTKTPYTFESARQITECNYSPYFTHTNYSTTSSIYSSLDSGHLADNVLSTIWSWDVNEPNTKDGDDRCTAIQVRNGRWQAVDCTNQYRVACRSIEEEHWVLTDDAYTYDRSLTACPDNYMFDVPRVPFQNTLLKNLISSKNVTEDRVWINLNLAYTVDQCWVVGRYGTCWWSDETGEEFLGLITTSVVGGVIILILVGIFIWIKCARLWRNRHLKSRKAMVKAMIKRREYVTIPA